MACIFVDSLWPILTRAAAGVATLRKEGEPLKRSKSRKKSIMDPALTEEPIMFTKVRVAIVRSGIFIVGFAHGALVGSVMPYSAFIVCAAI